MKYTNHNNISLSLAVFLAHDHYDHNDDPNTISVTSLIKPIKQTVMADRLPKKSLEVDIASLLKSRIGTAVHNAIELSWLTHHKESMTMLGYPKKIIDRIVVNPEPNDVPDGAYPVYMEIRSSKTVNGMTVSGKFDFVMNGTLTDFKTTSTYTYIYKTNDLKYKLQGSIYRWLNPDIITDSTFNIDYMFTNWTAAEAARSPNYPSSDTITYPIQLMSLEQTQRYVEDRVKAIQTLKGADESEMPRCTPYDLWQDAPKYKYYKNPDKMSRSTKNFDNLADANLRLATEGQGIVVTVPGFVKACKYCDVFDICKQKDEYIKDGSLKL